MTVTFDELLDAQLGNTQPEPDFRIQGDIHWFSALLYEWKLDNLTNGQVATRINADLADTEYNTVKTALNGMSLDEVLGLQQPLILGRRGDPNYTKADIRPLFGLT